MDPVAREWIMISDQELSERLLKNDREAFEAIVQKYQRGVFAYLKSRILSMSDAEDLTQEVFLRFYQARARFDTASLIRPWLLGIAESFERASAEAQAAERGCLDRTLP